jgi:transcriptional regulator with XRE-family HTH domain
MRKKYSKSEKALLKKLGARIRKLRIKEGFSQEELAFNAYLDRSYIGEIERGERNTSFLNLHKIAKALKISVSALTKI